MPYTMFVYDEKDVPLPTLGELYRVTNIHGGVLDYQIGGGMGSVVTLEKIEFIRGKPSDVVLETCDCDRSSVHDCVCPQCRARFLSTQQPHAPDAATAPRG